jgi:hypothetical protein
MLSVTNTWALVICLSVDGVILYGELLLKKAAIYIIIKTPYWIWAPSWIFEKKVLK